MWRAHGRSMSLELKLKTLEKELDAVQNGFDELSGPADKQLPKRAQLKRQATLKKLAQKRSSLVTEIKQTSETIEVQKKADTVRKAVVSGDEAQVRAILKASISPAALVNSQNFEGTSALIKAAMFQREEIMRALLDAGAKPDLHDERHRVALMFAAGNGNVNITELLLDAGASTNCTDVFGCTPFLHAVEGGHLDCCRLLLPTGEDASCLLAASVCRHPFPPTCTTCSATSVIGGHCRGVAQF